LHDTDQACFPDDYLQLLRSLEASYLATTDPRRQSGYGGSPVRWREEREPILAAVEGDGDFLDVGCANGYLLQCLVAWAGDRNIRLVPHGVDIGASLIELARQRFPDAGGNFHHANGFAWFPPQQYRYVFSLCDCVPPALLAEYCRRLQTRCVAPGGRLILGSYGSRSRGIAPLDVRTVLETFGFQVVGSASGGVPVNATFAWISSSLPVPVSGSR
jgi:SAM-dependent methyltransferase